MPAPLPSLCGLCCNWSCTCWEADQPHTTSCRWVWGERLNQTQHTLLQLSWVTVQATFPLATFWGITPWQCVWGANQTWSTSIDVCETSSGIHTCQYNGGSELLVAEVCSQNQLASWCTSCFWVQSQCKHVVHCHSSHQIFCESSPCSETAATYTWRWCASLCQGDTWASLAQVSWFVQGEW